VRGKRTGVLLLLVAALAGCGSSGHNSNPTLTTGQAQGLVAQLEAARAAAAAGNVAGTEAAIARFRGSVVRLRRAGALSDASARVLRIGAARVLARVKSENATPQAPAAQAQPTPAPAPAPAPAPPGHAKKHNEGKPGKDHGKGHGDGEGGD
jgi:hypothetical protein